MRHTPVHLRGNPGVYEGMCIFGGFPADCSGLSLLYRKHFTLVLYVAIGGMEIAMKLKKKHSHPASARDVEDNLTVAPMNAEWMPWNHGSRPSEDAPGASHHSGSRPPGHSQTPVRLTRAERRGLMRGALRAFLPVLIGTAVIALLLYLFAVLWLG